MENGYKRKLRARESKPDGPDLRDLSKPSDGDRRRPQHPHHAMRSRKRRKDLKELVDKVVRHDKNAADHRGDKEALTYARELCKYVAGALAVVQPYNPDGTAREGGDKREFWEWLTHMRDLLALRLPYERPRLASITLREDQPGDSEPYETIYELRATMVKKGLPVDHLIERRLMIDHEYTAGSNGGSTGQNQAD